MAAAGIFSQQGLVYLVNEIRARLSVSTADTGLRFVYSYRVRLRPAGALALQCKPKFDLFPQAAALGPAYSVSTTTSVNNVSTTVVCNGTSVCNAPVWQKSNQQAALAASGLSSPSVDAGMLKVVLPRASGQTLFFTISSPFLTVTNGTQFVDECLPDVPVAARKLLSSNTTAAKNVSVVTAGTMAYKIQIDNGTVEPYIPEGSLGVGGKLVLAANSASVSMSCSL